MDEMDGIDGARRRDLRVMADVRRIAGLSVVRPRQHGLAGGGEFVHAGYGGGFGGGGHLGGGVHCQARDFQHGAGERSSVSLLSVSVGSIISASGTISGK